MSWSLNYAIYSITLKWGANTASFFENEFLQFSSGPAVLGGIRWPILIGLAIVWFFIYLCLFKGVKTIGKIVKWTLGIPWVLLIILVIRGLTLPGAIEGLKYYLTPDFTALLKPGVWLAAYGQIFFSLSLGMGTMIVYSSYLPKKSDISNNSYITSLANCGTSFFAGFAVFSILGYLAQAMNVGVPDVTTSGFGLAFMTYPQAISLLPFWAPFFGVIFFILLLTLGIDSAFSQVEPFVAGFVEKWNISKKTMLRLVCLFGFLIGVVFTTRGGYYWLDIVDYFTCSFGLCLVGILECLVIGYIYKANKMRTYINEVSEFRVGKWWNVMIMVITPVILGISFIMEFVKLIQKGYGNYPRWTGLFGLGMIIVIVILSFVLMRVKGKSSTEIKEE